MYCDCMMLSACHVTSLLARLGGKLPSSSSSSKLQAPSFFLSAPVSNLASFLLFHHTTSHHTTPHHTTHSNCIANTHPNAINLATKTALLRFINLEIYFLRNTCDLNKASTPSLAIKQITSSQWTLQPLTTQVGRPSCCEVIMVFTWL